MKKKNVLILIAIVTVILLFFVIRFFSNSSNSAKDELINHEYLNLLVEYSLEENEAEKKQSTYNILYMMISDKALEEEAKRRGLKVSTEEVEQAIQEKVRENEGSGSFGIVSTILEGEDLTLEQFYREYNLNEIRQELLNHKLLEDIAENPPSNMSLAEYIKEINKEFRNKHKKEIVQLEAEYGVSDQEFNPFF